MIAFARYNSEVIFFGFFFEYFCCCILTRTQNNRAGLLFSTNFLFILQDQIDKNNKHISNEKNTSH